MKRIIVGTAALLMVFGMACSAGASAPKTLVSVYGDSLVYESKAFVLPNAKTEAITPNVHGHIGGAPCDILKALKVYLPKHPTTALVVLESAGNSRTTCMADPAHLGQRLSGQAWFDKYHADYQALFSLIESYGAKTLVVASPTFGEDNAPGWNMLHSDLWPLLRADAEQYPPGSIEFTDVARDAVGGDTFSATLPCLPSETATQGCDDGTIAARAPDQVHFCPTGLDQHTRSGCALPYSSGAVRYGSAITSEILRVLGK